MQDQHRFWRPKFLMALFVQVTSTIAMFSGHMDGGTWVASSTLTLSVFTAGNVTENVRLAKP